MASRTASAVSGAGHTSLLDSWQVAGQQQQHVPQQAELVAGLQQLHCDVQSAYMSAHQPAQQGVQLVQSRQSCRRLSTGLYPILSGEEGETQQQQQQQQQVSAGVVDPQQVSAVLHRLAAVAVHGMHVQGSCWGIEQRHEPSASLVHCRLHVSPA
jgi:hypothetical protein